METVGGGNAGLAPAVRSFLSPVSRQTGVLYINAGDESSIPERYPAISVAKNRPSAGKGTNIVGVQSLEPSARLPSTTEAADPTSSAPSTVGRRMIWLTLGDHTGFICADGFRWSTIDKRQAQTAGWARWRHGRSLLIDGRVVRRSASSHFAGISFSNRAYSAITGLALRESSSSIQSLSLESFAYRALSSMNRTSVNQKLWFSIRK